MSGRGIDFLENWIQQNVTMQNDMDAELEFWKAWAAMREKPQLSH